MASVHISSPTYYSATKSTILQLFYLVFLSLLFGLLWHSSFFFCMNYFTSIMNSQVHITYLVGSAPLELCGYLTKHALHCLSLPPLLSISLNSLRALFEKNYVSPLSAWLVQYSA